MIRSIHLKLTLWYIGVLAVILSIFALALYVRVADSLSRDIDDTLASQADGINEAIFAFREAKGTVSSPTQATGEEKKLPALIASWADQTGALESVHPLRLFDSKGRLLAASRRFDPIEATQSVLEKAFRGHATYETFSLPGHRVRVLTHPAIEDKQLLYIIQVAAVLKQTDDSLERLRLWLGSLVPVVLIAAAVVGWLLSKAALKPVAAMTREARSISAERLDLRIAVPRTGDELERLAETFNGMLEQLETAFKRIRQFSAAASHELRTPLTVMKGELEIALRKPRPADEYLRALSAQYEALEEMQHTVEQLLAVAHSGSSAGAIERQAIELGAFARRVVDHLGAVAHGKNVKLELQIEEPLVVKGEENLLKQLVVNLLDNAMRHSPSGSSVRLHLSRRGRYACLTVRDCGPGISPEKQAKLFEQFFDTSKPASSSPSTGLGLGLCRWIAEAHHGRIEAENIPQKGASFALWLPLAPES